ncbi:LysE family translocator [Actinoallomurus sp. CA-150999]|uniref:LysE family translocator n=1 Tax=Actinoallomurus sp. CA-150999 TaxID=3239887 RepID=UPI003D900CC6
MITAVLAFAGVAALINVTPGLDTLLVVRTSAGQGRRFGVAAALGILSGCVVWSVATAAGLTALLTASHLAYDALRIAGAGYLTWLGISALVRSRRRSAPSPGEASDQVAPDAVPRGWLTAFRSGMGTNLLNPKAGVFYMSLIPQFIPHGAPTFGTTLLLSAVDMVELAVWYWVVSGAAHALSERIRRPSFRRRMEQISGIAFLGFAVNLLVDEK